MKKTYFSALLGGFILNIGFIQATTVIPPTFDQLVGQAQFIFQGSVTNVRSMWVGEGGQRHIISYITFKVEDTMKGKPGASFVMEMLGGMVDGEAMEVTDSPKFQVGDRDILFVENNGEQFVPLVGINHGRFHVRTDKQTGRDIVTNGEDQPVGDVTKLGHEEEAATSAASQALSPGGFKAQIESKLAGQLLN
jgi:hypothetical protein